MTNKPIKEEEWTPTASLAWERDALKKLWKPEESLPYEEIMGYIDTIYNLRIELEDLKSQAIPKSKIEKIYHEIYMMYNDQRNNNQCARMNVTRKVMDMLEDVLGFSDENYDGTTD